MIAVTEHEYQPAEEFSVVDLHEINGFTFYCRNESARKVPSNPSGLTSSMSLHEDVSVSESSMKIILQKWHPQ